MDDPYNLRRFVQAQQGTWEQACTELRQGRKTRHWMWYIFPQLAGLGSSPTSQHFAISGLEEARAYLAHPILGPRLREACNLLLQGDDRPISDVLGFPDDRKLRSSMTLFTKATADNAAFVSILAKHFNEQFDPRTLAILGIAQG